MPIRTRPITRADRLEIDGTVFYFFPASGDHVLWETFTANATDTPAGRRAQAVACLAEHVTEVENLERTVFLLNRPALEGEKLPRATVVGDEIWIDPREVGQSVAAEDVTEAVRVPAWPGRLHVPRPIAEEFPDAQAVTDDEHAARVLALRELPWNILARLDRLVARSHREATESGKG